MLAIGWPKLAPLQSDLGGILRTPGSAEGAAVVEIMFAEELSLLDDLRRFVEGALLVLDGSLVDGERFGDFS